MFRTMMKSKIHRATVTQTNLNYVGSITIDTQLMEAADLLENERVQVVNINTGARFDTYVIPGDAGTGVIGLNGAAARLAEPGDLVIIISYAMYENADALQHEPTVVLVDENNRIQLHLDSEAEENRRLAEART
ncbi:aspartate 1-decarboxylase [Alicyclobacillus hesperidum URH17-3-68]|uniref:Aspartate 1-decarboxylase n=1 Tax=Alicyclobacillus hesperidum TaxID=89784 RepID=A0A1H2URW2_9BACL|nr:aspartate 1-decarboxylase [Alicyclobacillus hesperidum]EJY56591.1 aspartate 1-decarboxylase [Alicyclobacillus hesperidum URH17-3-68]GLG02058.1 aspartate 1-decarboxylase [Alicyclobacillus hesperidum subsp. aegles]GLV14317.1 aspartate 1-decarboxylase [Alicyclobacillus hesperidum]SDW58294.1 L-aspartate 1-decarboxylase [Alicyclobacillus hesperidum]